MQSIQVGLKADFVDVENQEAGNIFSSVSKKFKWGEKIQKLIKLIHLDRGFNDTEWHRFD